MRVVARAAESGLDAAHARKLHLRGLDADAVVALGHAREPQSKFEPRAACWIPYFDRDGKVDPDFFRLRYLDPPVGFDAQAEKSRKYDQPAGTFPRPYLPPLLSRSWAEVAADASQPIVVTEGEFKAASACARGFACVGLGGVSSWRSAKKGWALLPELESFAWKGRDVSLCFDSDLDENADVLRALSALASTLVDRGAQPRVAFVPPGPGGEKRGLDDFLVAAAARGRDASEELLDLLEAAEEVDRSRQLWELNREVVLVRNPGVVVAVDRLERMAPSQFVEVHYANRRYAKTTVDKKGKAVVSEEPLAREWIKWAHRAEVARFTYRPGQPRVVADELNVWPGWGATPKKGDVGPWLRLMDYVFGKDDRARDYFERWCAYQFQHPGTKSLVACVLYGRIHGTGKSQVGMALGRVFGENFVKVSGRELRSDFNDWAYAKQFVLGDEVTGGDRRLESEAIKDLITQRVVNVNQKYVARFQVPDLCNYLFTTNHSDAFHVEDSDRRYFVHELRGPRLPEAFAEELARWMGPEGEREWPGPRALHQWMLDRPLDGFNPMAAALETEAKREMRRASRTDLQDWIAQLRDAPDSLLRIGGKPSERDLWTAEELLRIYDPGGRTRVGAAGMGRALRNAGFRPLRSGPMRTSVGARRLYPARNQGKWEAAPPAEAVEHYEKLAGSGR